MTTLSSNPFRLRTAVWELTLKCCFNCEYCGSRAGTARDNELNTSECLAVVRQLAELGCQRVNLIGGDVFLRPDWQRITAALTERGMKVCIITNGFLMTESILSALADLGIESVAVSIDGPERVHDVCRQNGSYQRALKSIIALTDRGIPTSVISALRADNAPLLPEFYETLKCGYPIFAWQIQACSPMGNAGNRGIDTHFDLLQIIRFVTGIASKSPFRVMLADNIGYFSPEEPNMRGQTGAVFGGCSAGLSTIGIDSMGNVRGCESLYDDFFIEGNLLQKSLREIWESDNAFSYNRHFNREWLTGKCAECEVGEFCAGGCRSYNYFTTGRLYEYPLCAKQAIQSGTLEANCGDYWQTNSDD